MMPMAIDGQEAIGSMGNDTPLAVLSDRPQLLYNYFKQLFAQVTNPPLDAIREEIITSMVTTIGSEGNLLDETAEQCRLLRLDRPIITNEELARIKALNQPGLQEPHAVDVVPARKGRGMRRRLDELRREASRRDLGRRYAVDSFGPGRESRMGAAAGALATSGVHHHLIREKTRTRCGLIIESGEPREVQHFALLTAYGAGAINPYLALATLDQLHAEGYISDAYTIEKLHKSYVKAGVKGLLKVMSKMGISTQQSYRGAQIFEAIGLNADFVEEFFTRTSSRIQGIGLEAVAEEGAAPARARLPAGERTRNARFGRRRAISMAAQGRGAPFQSRGGRQAAAFDAIEQPRGFPEILPGH